MMERRKEEVLERRRNTNEKVWDVFLLRERLLQMKWFLGDLEGREGV